MAGRTRKGHGKAAKKRTDDGQKMGGRGKEGRKIRAADGLNAEMDRQKADSEPAKERKKAGGKRTKSRSGSTNGDHKNSRKQKKSGQKRSKMRGRTGKRRN